jgi:hypothetical protein
MSLRVSTPKAFRCGGEEVASAVPAHLPVTPHETQVRFVDQCGRLKRVAGRFLSYLLRRQLPQLLIDEGQELLGGMRITFVQGGQDAGNLAHVKSIPRAWQQLQQS